MRVSKSPGAFPTGPVLPRIKTSVFVKEVSQVPGMTKEQMPITLPMVGDLLLTFSVDVEQMYISISPKWCQEQRVGHEQLLSMALQNLAPLLGSLKIQPKGPAFQIVTGNDMEACTILLSGLWNDVAARLKDAPVAIFPHRNSVFFSSKGSPGGLGFLKGFVSQFNFNVKHALSAFPYIWQNGKWNAYDWPTW